MFNHKAQLVTLSTQGTVNTYGDPIETVQTTRTVFCRIVSADEKEKTLAESRGQSAELVIILPDKLLYNEELYVNYDSIRYRITDKKFSDTGKELRLVVGRWETH